MTASNFNLNDFLRKQEYNSYMEKHYTAAENGRAAMEERAIQKAEEAVKDDGFLSLTLGEKLAEIGIGERVVQQIGDTAANVVKGIVDPLADYLEKYENIFDQNVYNSEIQTYAKQMFFANQEMSKVAAEDTTGQNFVYTM